MANLITRLFQRITDSEPPLHPVERRLSKEYVKKRLAKLFPELKNDPEALEKAYQSLKLSARRARHADEPDVVFRIDLPGHL